MSPLNSNSRKRRASQQKSKRSSRPRPGKQAKKADRPSLHQQAEQIRVFAALNRVRRREARSLTGAARAEGTTLRAMRKLAPDALVQVRPGGRLRVKSSDRYSAKVQILAHDGALTTTARGSRERELAGQHRATYMRVLRGVEPKSALEPYRGKKVGGHELLSDYAQLVLLAKAGVLGQLDTLYVSAGGGR